MLDETGNRVVYVLTGYCVYSSGSFFDSVFGVFVTKTDAENAKKQLDLKEENTANTYKITETYFWDTPIA